MEECWIRSAQPIGPVPRALGPIDHPLVFAAGPSNDIGVDPFQGWTQLRRIEVAKEPIVARWPGPSRALRLCRSARRCGRGSSDRAYAGVTVCLQRWMVMQSRRHMRRGVPTLLLRVSFYIL